MTIKHPTQEQTLLYSAVRREFARLSETRYSEEFIDLVVSNFVWQYDFKNTALAHKSPGGWAQMLLLELGTTEERE